MMRTQRVFTVWMFLLLLCASARAQTAAPTPKKPDAPVSGTIDGHVVNESGQPMAGAALTIRPVNSQTIGRTVTTDSDGNFRVNGLEPSLYIVSAYAPAYTSVAFDPTAPEYHRIGETVRVELIRGGAITGTVTNSLGEPVIAVRVRATMIRDAHGQPAKLAPNALLEQPTDDRGIYRIYGVAPGTYLVSAGGSGLTPIFNPYDRDVPTYAPSSTRDNAAEVVVQGGEDTNIDIRYRGEQGHIISGIAKTSGPTTASISLSAPGSLFPLAGTYQLSGSRGFVLNGVPDGDYDLMAQEVVSNNTAAAPLLALSEKKRVTVKGADVTGVELLTRPLGAISGRFVLQPSRVPECKDKRAPLFAETVVQLRRPEKEVERDDLIVLRMFATGSPDANGAFVLRNVTPGRYQFEPRFYARYWYLQSITMNARTDAAANWTTVKSGDQVSNLTITLTGGAASVHGAVPVPEGATLPADMTVYLVPSETDKAEDVLRYFVRTIAADGTFALNNLPPGKYLALVQDNADPQIATIAKLRQPEAAATRAKLRRAADAKKNNLELRPCQNVAGYQPKQ